MKNDVLTDDFFKKIGFNTNSEPFTKDSIDGLIKVYKNYIRDGSGRYDGYIVIKPMAMVCKTLDDFIGRY